MLIFHTGDIHYSQKHLREADRCLDHLVGRAIDAKCDAAVIAGDTFDHRIDLHAPAVAAVLEKVKLLAEFMPVLILQGTYSHDTPGSLDVFRTLGGKCPVCVADEIEQVALIRDGDDYRWENSGEWVFEDLPANTMALFSCLPPVNKGAVAAAVGAEDAGKAAGEYVGDLLKGWSPSHLAARQAGIPAVLVSHGTVSGCVSEQGVPMVGLDHEFTTGSLLASESTAVMLGHIHQMQSWGRDGRMIAYPGSPGRLHFGEVTEKGGLIWTLTPDTAEVEFVVTPAKTLLQIDYDGTPDLDDLAEIATKAAGAHVRIRFSVDEEHRHGVDKNAIRQMFIDAGAEEVKVEGRINPVVRTRSAGISKASSLADKLRTWADVAQVQADPLTERLSALNAHEPDEIVAGIVKPKQFEKNSTPALLQMRGTYR